MQLCICHHYLLLTSAIITELDSVFDVSKKSRRKSVFDQCLAWHVFASHHSIHPEFCRHLHMSFQFFQKLVGLLNNSLLVDQEMASLCGGAIIPELCVYVTLQYLAGGSYMDIFFLIGISKSSFFHLLWKTIKAINKCIEHRLLGPTPRNGKLNVLVDLHPLAQIMPCMNVLLFWMDTICRQQPLPRKKYIMCRHTSQDTTKPME